MSTPYAGNDSYPTNITLPDDGDDFCAASMNVPFEALADRTTYLKTRHDRLKTFGGVATTASVGTSNTTVAGATATACEVGDELVINWSARLSTVPDGPSINYAFKLLENGVPVSPFPDALNSSVNVVGAFQTYRHVVTVAGDVIAYIDASAEYSTITVHGPGTAVLIHRVRP